MSDLLDAEILGEVSEVPLEAGESSPVPVDFSADKSPERPTFDGPVESILTEGAVEEIKQGAASREALLSEALRRKAEKEAELKRARQADGRKELEEFHKARKAELIELRAKNKLRKEEAEASAHPKNAAESWALIIANIALKEGDYPGTANVARMKAAIVNQANHLKNRKDN